MKTGPGLSNKGVGGSRRDVGGPKMGVGLTSPLIYLRKKKKNQLNTHTMSRMCVWVEKIQWGGGTYLPFEKKEWGWYGVATPCSLSTSHQVLCRQLGVNR